MSQASQYTGLEMTLVQGDIMEIHFVIKDIDGKIQDLAGFSSIKFKYKKYGDGSTSELNGWLVDPANGKIGFDFALTGWEATDYDCEIELKSGTEEITCPDIVLHIVSEL